MVTTPESIAIRRGQIRLLIEAGQTTSQIAQNLNERRSIVVSDIRALGLTPAKGTTGPRNKARNDTLAAQIRELAEKGTKRSHIASELGISYDFLTKLMGEYNIPKPARIPEHGTIKEYRTHRCRCVPCTAANTAAIAAARAARKARLSPDSPVHGTVSGYNNHLCRCVPCSTAGAQFYADYRATPPQRTRRSWTAEEDAAILDYTYTAKEHSERLNRPVPSVQSRRTLLLQNGAERRVGVNERISAEEAKSRRAAAAKNRRAEAVRNRRAAEALLRAAEADLKREEAALAEKLALEAILIESRRGAVKALALQGMSRTNIMATLEIDYETLRGDLEVLQLPAVPRRVPHGTSGGRGLAGAAPRTGRSVLVGR